MRRIYSFGYKLNGEDQFAVTGHSAPLVIDCRGLYNPHSSPELRKLTGKDEAVQEAVLTAPGSGPIVHRAMEHLKSSPDAQVAFGCSYGKHRSVALAEYLAAYFPDAQVIHTGAVAR